MRPFTLALSARANRGESSTDTPCRACRPFPPECSESPLDASPRRSPDVSRRGPFHMRRANAAVSKARGAFHRPVSPQPLRANAEHHFEQVEPLVASHLAALTRGARLATLATGHLSAPTSGTESPFVDPAAQQLPFGGHCAPTTDMSSRLVSHPLDRRPFPSASPMPPTGFCRPNDPQAHQRTPFAPARTNALRRGPVWRVTSRLLTSRRDESRPTPDGIHPCGLPPVDSPQVRGLVAFRLLDPPATSARRAGFTPTCGFLGHLLSPTPAPRAWNKQRGATLRNSASGLAPGMNRSCSPRSRAARVRAAV